MSDVNVQNVLESLPPLEQDVYRFMVREYELLEQAGEKYDEAANDTYVEQKAGKEFNISAEEAGTIYAKAESQIRRANLHQASE
ncbi:hypothetical protein SAMN05192534_12824 [Alteribacillus persepolensis]|uniref:Uncharacterized protein n=1 Tax=Alteribacillus persepolensis TaxID=568899 RepID=A0A1G8J2D0_9BACI|nr:hypothetical protein [Alteribacillus persepolensis]SDI25346.1 hypothetical protein SAMN05192534_12824 [Alteribacillus persepolensis]